MSLHEAKPVEQTTESAGRWRTLADGRGSIGRPAPTMRRAVAVFAALSTVAFASILVVGWAASGRAALNEALRDARAATNLLATAVVEPALEDGLLTGDPGSIARLDEVIRDRVLTNGRVRVKFWTEEGRIIYSDETRLIGRVFPLDATEARTAQGGEPTVEIDDLSGPEDAFESSEQQLLEVYRHVALPNGTHLLFETYTDYSHTEARRAEILRSFGPNTLGAVMLLQLCQLPLVWSLVRRLRAAQLSGERLLRKAIEASNAERRRIAGNVHDDVVQGLAGASFVIAGAVDEIEKSGKPGLAADLREAARGVRESIRALRSILVEIYPPNVSVAGLPTALHDLVSPLRSQGIVATADTPSTVDLPPAHEALIFRVAQETLRNVAHHSGARTARLTLTVDAGVATLEVADDGIGVDVDTAVGRHDGHVGMQVLRDLTEEAGAVLRIRSAVGAGTTMRLEIPRTSKA